MTRYLNILRIFWSASVSAEMEYRVNFMMAALSSVMTLAGTVLMLFLFYRTGYEMGGWPWRDALAVVGVFTFLEGTQSTFMTPNRTRVTEHVREGTLDFILLKPIDSQFWLSVRTISLWGTPNILMGLAIVVYAGAAGTVLEPTPGSERGKIFAALEQLSAGGSTAGGEGLDRKSVV